MLNNNKGITLIILVVTVIVMIILAGIFISSTANNDLIEKSKNVVDLNNDLINKTQENEKNLLVQNVTSFTVPSMVAAVAVALVDQPANVHPLGAVPPNV